MFESNLINLTAIHSNKNKRDRGTSFIILKSFAQTFKLYKYVTKSNSGPLQFSNLFHDPVHLKNDDSKDHLFVVVFSILQITHYPIQL